MADCKVCASNVAGKVLTKGTLATEASLADNGSNSCVAKEVSITSGGSFDMTCIATIKASVKM